MVKSFPQGCKPLPGQHGCLDPLLKIISRIDEVGWAGEVARKLPLPSQPTIAALERPIF